MNLTAPIRVLIVDDDEDDFFLTSEYIKTIKGSAFVIDWSYRYKDAFDRIIGREYDIYFIDYRLGAKTGLDLLKEALENNCEEPMILLTGKGNQAIDVEAMQAGAIDYLVKSELNTEKLERCIRYALERTNSTKRLKANERKFRSIFEKSKDIVFLADEELVFRDVNHVATELLEYDRNELLKMSLYTLLANKETRQVLRKEILSQGEVDDKEIELLTKSNEKISCILSVSTETNITGEKYTQGIIHDITNLKKAEKVTLQAEKLRAAGRLVSTLAHEVRNPLNNINLAVDQLYQDDTINGDTKMFLDIVNRNSKRIALLISELLNSAGPTEMALHKKSLREILDDTLTVASDRITLKKISVDIFYDDEELYILADTEKLKIAFLNIIINAIEAVSEETGKLVLKAVADNGYHKVIIADNGTGINEENLARLFEPYFTSKRNGLGLGLAGTLNILQSHKALIDVKSKIGEGSIFTISFKPA
ncbi:MAG TPA: ATP-binding protein [Chitinophagaceae bacterium]|nr:ATP-binding protein [Chitinophagaceae bacterium]